MDAYASYIITLAGNDNELTEAVEMLNEAISDQECFSAYLASSKYIADTENEQSSLTRQEIFTVTETHICVWLEDVLELANNMAYYVPGISFSISGHIEDLIDHIDDMMDFEITYRNKKLTSQSTCWYIHILMDDFNDYKAFCARLCDHYGNPRYTEEEYEGFRDCANEWYVLDSGQGEFSPDVPFDDPVRIKIKHPKKNY